jgi:hypothetical protein
VRAREGTRVTETHILPGGTAHLQRAGAHGITVSKYTPDLTQPGELFPQI